MIGTSQLINAFGAPVCFTDTTDIFKDRSGVALYGLDYDASDAGGASGKFGEAAIFNGSSSYVTTSLDFSNLTDYSISMWIYIPATLSNSTFFAGTINSSALNGIYFSINTNNTIRWFERNSSTSITQITSTDTITVGSWNNFVAVRNGGTNYLYVNNGTPVSASNASITHATDFTLGRAGSYNTGLFDGKIDQVRIFNSALTSSQVTQLYQENNSTVGTHLFGCIANYNLDGSAKESMGTTAYDGTETDIIYRYDGTPTDVDFGVGGKSNYGARFNGSSSKIDLGNNSSNNSSTISVSLWFKTSGSSAATIINNGGANSGETGYFLGLNSNGTIKFEAGTGTVNGSVNYADSQWHQIVLTLNSGAYNIYVDGNTTPVITGSGAFTTTATRPTWIGQFSYTPAALEFFNGSIDQVRIFNKAISAAEVSKLYGNGAGEIACEYTSTTDNIAFPIANTAYYKLDNNSKDSALSTGKFNGAAAFNGSSSKIALNSSIASVFTDNFTFSAWVFPADNSNYICLFSAEFGMELYFYQGAFQLYSNDANNDTNRNIAGFSTTTTNYAINQWHHVALKFTKTSQTWFINGQEDGTNTTSSYTPYQASLISVGYFERQDGGANHYVFNGSIDQVRIYNTALSSTDISNLYAETVSTTGTLSFPSGQTAIATYQLDGNSNDISGNYNGTDTNITYAYDGTDTNMQYRFGPYGQAGVFSGSSLIEIPAKIPQSLNFTVSFWFNSTSTYASSYMFSTKHNSVTNGWWIILNNSVPGSINYGEGNGSTNATTITSNSTNLNDGNWHHAVVTRAAGGTVNMYIDGVRERQDASVGSGYMTSNTWHDNLHIGRYAGTNSLYYTGKIDQVRIFESVLSPDQATKLYNEKPEADTSNFKTVLYTGNGGSQYISNVGFEPDFVWIKQRSGTASHSLQDSVREAGQSKNIYSDNTAAEGTYGQYGYLSSFDTNGFTVEAGSGSHTNANGSTYVAWVWKGSNADAVSNTQGTNITSSVSANTAAGFSIVKWTGSNSVSDTVGHGLIDAEMVILKDLNDGTNNWRAWHKDLSTNHWLYLNLTNAEVSAATDGGIRNVDANTFGFINGTTAGVEAVNSSASDYIAYVWKSISGYSKIGSYTGNGTYDNKIFTTNDGTSTGSGGFEPSFVMIKNTETSGTGWLIMDKARDPINTAVRTLRPNSSAAEDANTSYFLLDWESDGFRLKYGLSNETEFNQPNKKYLFMAFK